MLLAEIAGGGGLVYWLIALLVVGICCLLVWWVGNWFIGKLGAPAIVKTLWDGLFILVGLVVVVNALLGAVGHPLFPFWRQ